MKRKLQFIVLSFSVLATLSLMADFSSLVYVHVLSIYFNIPLLLKIPMCAIGGYLVAPFFSEFLDSGRGVAVGITTTVVLLGALSDVLVAQGGVESLAQMLAMATLPLSTSAGGFASV